MFMVKMTAAVVLLVHLFSVGNIRVMHMHVFKCDTVTRVGGEVCYLFGLML